MGVLSAIASVTLTNYLAFVAHLTKNDERQQLLNAWQAWANKVQPGTGEQRDVAVQRLKNDLARPCYYFFGWQLDLSNLGLTELPLLFPKYLTRLDISKNRLTSLPENLPNSLLTLFAENNQIKALPERISDSLAILDVSDNQLTSLPLTLSRNLKMLIIAGNQLTSLPENLPRSLKYLNLNNNQLTHLPRSLPSALQVLQVKDNKLTNIPITLMTSIKKLCLDNNPLDDHVRRADFLAELAHWQQNTVHWATIFTEDYAYDFKIFLYKIRDHMDKTRHIKDHLFSLQRRIIDWLSYLVKDGHEALRRETFLLANQAKGNSVDNALFYFTYMYILYIEHQLINGDASFTRVIKTIHRRFRLQVLEEIGQQYADEQRKQSPEFNDDLKICLIYQYRLRKPLALPIYITLQPSEINSVTDDDINKAKKAVDNAEQCDFARYWLTQSTFWQAILEKWKAQEDKDTADKRHLATTSFGSFNQMVENALTEKGVNNDDIEEKRNVSKDLAEKLLHQERYPRSLTCLAKESMLKLCDRIGSPFQRTASN